jgi:hypothetical protein
MKEETTSNRLRTMDVGTLTTLGTVALTDPVNNDDYKKT